VTAPVTVPTLPAIEPTPSAETPVPEPADLAVTDPLPAEPVTVLAPSTAPIGPDQAVLDVALPAPPDTAVVASESEAPADCQVSHETLPDPQEATSASSYEAYYGGALYLSALNVDPRLTEDGQHTTAPPAGSAPGGTAPPAPGNDRPSPWPQGTGLPAPNALPAAPGSGSGTTLSSGGPGCAAAWLPSQYLVIPTTGAEPIRGPLQHVHSADAADPGSSPD